MITWQQRLRELRKALGRAPTRQEIFAEAKKHKMTPEEIQAQRESWARANVSTGDPRFD